MNAEHSGHYFVFHPHVALVAGQQAVAIYNLLNTRLYWFRDPGLKRVFEHLVKAQSAEKAAQSSDMSWDDLLRYMRILEDLGLGWQAPRPTVVESYHPGLLKSQAEHAHVFLPNVTVGVEPSEECPYSCPWCTGSTIRTDEACTCGVWKDHGRKIETEEIISSIELLANRGLSRLRIRGGEPLTEMDFINKLLQSARRLSIGFELHSTGFTVEPAMLKSFEGVPLRFSLIAPSSEADHFDSLVGRTGAWSRFLQTTSLLKHGGLEFTVKIPVPLDASSDHVLGTVEWSRKLGASDVKYFFYLAKPDSSISLMKKILGPRTPADMTVDMQTFLSQGQCHPCYENAFFIVRDGRITPCIGNRTALANLHEHDMARILREDMLAPLWNTGRSKTAACMKCEFRFGCRACLVRTKQVNGSSAARHWNCRYNPDSAEWETS